MMPIRTIATLLVATGLLAPGAAWAQAYPSRPARIVVGFPAGGATDIMARLMGEWLTQRLGQQFIVENKPGVSGNVGTETETLCPICEESKLRIVTYVFGHHLPAHGRCVSTATEMRRLAQANAGDRTAYMVEACTACRWHHLLRVWSI